MGLCKSQHPSGNFRIKSSCPEVRTGEAYLTARQWCLSSHGPHIIAVSSPLDAIRSNVDTCFVAPHVRTSCYVRAELNNQQAASAREIASHDLRSSITVVPTTTLAFRQAANVRIVIRSRVSLGWYTSAEPSVR